MSLMPLCHCGSVLGHNMACETCNDYANSYKHSTCPDCGHDDCQCEAVSACLPPGSRRAEVEDVISELERMDGEAMPPEWRFESYPSGSRVVTMNSFTVTGEYGDQLPCSGVSRHITENRQILCDCCPASARHWVGAKHDDQEWQDLAYIAKLRNAAPSLFDLARTLADEVDAKDAVITKLLELFAPEPILDHYPNTVRRKIYRENEDRAELYARACEIAGRAE